MKKPEFLISPKLFVMKGGTFKFPKTSILSSSLAEDNLSLKLISSELERISVKPVINGISLKPDILIQRNGAIKDCEGYTISIDKNIIIIRSAAAAGAFYGIQTLIELIRMFGNAIPCAEIEDSPAFRRRAIYFDCSRGKVPKISTLKSLVDLLASWKINELQLYIENVFTFKKHTEIGKGFDPFTPSDILELQEYCNTRFISFVPSLASFGHMEKILMLPKFQHLAELPGHRNMAGGTTLNPAHPGSIKLIEDLFAEFVPLFKAENFNVCGDEPWELGKGASANAASKVGVGKVYLDFILKIRELCFKHNKRMNLWSDIVLNHPEIIPQIPKDIAMLNWQYDMKYKERRLQRSNEITDAGLPLVCCPGTNSWQSHGTRLDMSTETVSRFARKGLELNAEGFMNTDWGDGGHRNPLAISLCSFAHSASHAWNSKGVNDNNHVERFTKHMFDDTSGKFAAALRILGTKESGNWAYATFNESFYEAKPFYHFFGHDFIRMNSAEISENQFKKRDTELKKISFSAICPTIQGFKKEMIEEYDLAVMLEQAAWERLSLSKIIRSGKHLNETALRNHKVNLQNLLNQFSKTWRKLNRNSRLRDNEQMFKCAINEIK